MPELPEVETVVRTLEQQIKSCTITEVVVIYSPIIANVSTKEFCQRLLGQTFENFKRRGKYLIFELTDEILICHLRMEGKFFVEDNTNLKDKHTHILLKLSNGKILMYHDVRKFGRMYLYKKNEELVALSSLGLEPWDVKLTVDYLKEKTKKLKQPLKQVLLDQSIIAGIGNIYANEICFALKRLPETNFSELNDKELADIIKFTREILKVAIAQGGTTIRSYTSSLGVSGRFQQELMVHSRANEPCKICKEKIVKTKLKGRGTYHCPRCQK